MDRRERSGDTLAAMLAYGEGLMASVWTALPGIITAVNLAKKTVSVQPSIRARVQAQDGSFSWVNMPLCVDVPVYFPSGGGGTLTFPLAAGDECLLVFSARCIDAWWQSGGIQNQPDLRKLDLSDGFAFVGISSVPNVPAAISTTEVQLRSNDGTAYVGINVTNKAVNVKSPFGITLDAPQINLVGNVVGSATAVFSGNVTGAGKSLQTHTHSGVQPGAGTSGPPT